MVSACETHQLCPGLCPGIQPQGALDKQDTARQTLCATHISPAAWRWLLAADPVRHTHPDTAVSPAAWRWTLACHIARDTAAHGLCATAAGIEWAVRLSPILQLTPSTQPTLPQGHAVLGVRRRPSWARRPLRGRSIFRGELSVKRRDVVR